MTAGFMITFFSAMIFVPCVLILWPHKYQNAGAPGCTTWLCKKLVVVSGIGLLAGVCISMLQLGLW